MSQDLGAQSHISSLPVGSEKQPGHSLSHTMAGAEQLALEDLGVKSWQVDPEPH